MIAKYPDQRNINNFAVFSCLANDKNITQRLMSMIEGRSTIPSGKISVFLIALKGLD